MSLDKFEDCLLALADPGVSNSLSGDEKLLETLMEVSALLTARSAKCSESVRELCLEATTTQVALQNAMTRMSLLANTKFIESVSVGPGVAPHTVSPQCCPHPPLHAHATCPLSLSLYSAFLKKTPCWVREKRRRRKVMLFNPR